MFINIQCSVIRPYRLLVNTVSLLCRDLERVQLRETCPFHLHYCGWLYLKETQKAASILTMQRAVFILREESSVSGQSCCIRGSGRMDQYGEICVRPAPTVHWCNLVFAWVCLHFSACCLLNDAKKWNILSGCCSLQISDWWTSVCVFS